MSWEGNWHTHTYTIKIQTSHWAAGVFTEILLFWQAQIIKILQAASSEQPVGLHRLVFHGFRWNHIFLSMTDFLNRLQLKWRDLNLWTQTRIPSRVSDSFDRFLGALHSHRPGPSEPVGFLPRVWAAVVWTRTMHGHPDSDSSGVCKNQTRVWCGGDFCKMRADSRMVALQAETTPELYYASLSLTLASVCSTGDGPSPQSDTLLGFTSKHQHLLVSVQLFLQWEEDSGWLAGCPWPSRTETLQLSHTDTWYAAWWTFMWALCRCHPVT